MGENRPPRINLNPNDHGAEQNKPPRIHLNQPDLFLQQSITEEAGRPPRIYIEQYEQPEPIPAPVFSDALILGLAKDTGEPVTVTQTELHAGTYIAGVQRMGKSQLLEQIGYQQMQTGEAVIILDPHGDLVDAIIAHMPEADLSRCYFLDLKDAREYPFGLSVFACSNPQDEEARDVTRNQIMHAFEKLWPDTREGVYFNQILRHIVITLIENPELTLASVKKLLIDSSYRDRFTRNLKNTETRFFWHEEYNKLSESKRDTRIAPLRDRLDKLLTEPVIKRILMQTKKTVNIRKLIEERAILLVRLPVNEEAYKYSAPVIGTFLLSMIYAATFSFADIPLDKRPGFTLIVDEFQNFATDEYAKLFEQGGKYKVKQFLAHQHRQQLERGTTTKTNLAATLSAQTMISFRVTPPDARELAPLLIGIGERRRPTDISIHPLDKIDTYPHPLVKQFVLDVVDKLDAASGQKLETRRETYKDYDRPIFRRWSYRPEYRERSYTYKVDPQYDFGSGSIETNPKKAEAALTLLDRLIYESEEQGEIIAPLKEQFINAVAPFWKFVAEKQEDTTKPDYSRLRAAELAEARQRRDRFINLLDTVLAILIKQPIAEDSELSHADIAGILEHQPKRAALAKTGHTAYEMETRDTAIFYSHQTTPPSERLRQVQERTRARFCVYRDDMDGEPEIEADQDIADREEADAPELADWQGYQTHQMPEEPEDPKPYYEEE
jgi:hypothetical protein